MTHHLTTNANGSLRVPDTMYQVITYFGQLNGVGDCGDFTTSLDDCADQAGECELADQPWRAFRIDMDAANSGGRFVDITREVAVVITDRMKRWADDGEVAA